MMGYKIIFMSLVVCSVSLLGMNKPVPGTHSMQRAAAAAQHKSALEVPQRTPIKQSTRTENFGDLEGAPDLEAGNFQASDVAYSQTATNKILVLQIKQLLVGASCSDDRLEESIAQLQHANFPTYQKLVSHFSAEPVTRGRKGTKPQAHSDAMQLLMHQLMLSATEKEKNEHSKRADEQAQAAKKNKWLGIGGTGLAGIVTFFLSNYFKQQC